MDGLPGGFYGAYAASVSYTHLIGDTTVGKIIAAATGHNVSLWTVLCEPLAYGLNFNKVTVGKVQAFRELISAFITDAAEKNEMCIRDRYKRVNSGSSRPVTVSVPEPLW